MCQKKPGLRCSNHANKAMHAAAKRMSKAKSKSIKNPDSLELHQKYMELKKAHQLAADLFYATPLMIKMVSPTAKLYKMASYMNKSLKSAAKNQKNPPRGQAFEIGHRINLSDGQLSYNSESSKIIVGKSNSRYIVWNENKPYSMIIINKTDFSSEKIDCKDPQKSYGYGVNKKPDIHWAIWYAKKVDLI